MRLIDADALREVMYHEAFEKDTDMQKWDSGCWIRYKMFENAIESAPTIDPVLRGRWIEARLVSTTGGTYGVRRCSLCGADYQDVGYGWDYCPNCGAKMEVSE